MKNYNFSIIASIVLCTIATNAQFIINDVIISDVTSSLTDPEVDWYGNHICWANEEGVWVADIDPITGNINPINGKGILVDSTPSILGMQAVANGPEWAMSQEGSEIIYPEITTEGSGICIGRIKLINGNWTQVPAPLGVNRIPFFASYDVDYPNGAVTSAGLNTNPVSQAGKIIRYVNNAASEVNLGTNNTGGRWIKGAEGITFTKNIGGNIQAGYYLMSTGQEVIVTNNTNPKEQVWMFRSPEYNNELILTCIEKFPTYDELAIYRSISGVWQKVNGLQSPSNRKVIFSPEPFWYNNKSYFFFKAEKYPTDPNSYYDQIWIMGIDPLNPFSRQVSNEIAANRTDPEVFYTTTEPVIYYTESNNGIKIMHKCSTGLDQLLSINTETLIESNQLLIHPNPSNNFLNVNCNNGFQIYSSTGQLIEKSSIITSLIDISKLANGVYILKSESKIGKFIKN
jgi:hypothetical protein